MKLQWDWQHTLVMVGTTVGGAILGYLQSQPPTTLFAAFGSWETAKPLVFGAIYAAIAALIALSKQTFLASAPVEPPKYPDTKISAKWTSSAPPPPNAARRMLSGAVAFACLVVFLVPLLGCPQFVPVVGPAIDTGVCAVEEALKGKTLLEIWNDCKGDLAKIIEALLASSDPQVRASAAFRDAVRARAALQADKCQ